MPGRPRDAAKTEKGFMPDKQINHGQPVLLTPLDYEGSPVVSQIEPYEGGEPGAGSVVVIEPELHLHWTRGDHGVAVPGHA